MTAWSRAARARGERIAFVPTMGALHAGHVALLEEGRRRGDKLVLSIFVNPTQFGPNEDLARYPRDLPGDLAKAAGAGTDVAFVPEPLDIYPPGFQTTIEVRELARGLDGALSARALRRRGHGGRQALQHRPARRGHLRPEGLPAARHRPAPGRRPGDGDRDRRPADRARARRPGHVLAQRLPLAGRANARAVALARALRRPRARAAGERDAQAPWSTAPAPRWTSIASTTSSSATPRRLAPLPADAQVDRPAVLLVAAFIGRTRLIDNVEIAG